MKCDECETSLPCVQWINKSHTTKICKECNEQYEFCYTKCKNPCRSKAEQKEIFSKVKPEWNNVIIN